MLLGYNTNGFAHHRLSDTFEILAEIGYRAIAVTLDHTILDPPDHRGLNRAIQLISAANQNATLRVTIETGARYILDPRRKHQPTLISSSPTGRELRLKYLHAAAEIAAAINADSVALWSGAPDENTDNSRLFERLSDSLETLLHRTESPGARFSFEPEPDMFVDTMHKFAELHQRLSHPRLGLTLDIGHLHCLADGNLADHVTQWHQHLWNIHIEDMLRSLHEHLPLGQGEIDFAHVFRTLRSSSYSGPIHVELPRQSHIAVDTARASFSFINQLLHP